MKIVVTGATGFVGQHVVKELLERGHSVSAIARNSEKAKKFKWFKQIDEFFLCDLQNDMIYGMIEENGGKYDALMHLAWNGLPNYMELFHLEKNLPADYLFIKNMVNAGTKQVLVTGTSYEYGLQNGCMTEETETRPANPYAIAKDTLRKELQMLQKKEPFILQWARLFFMYGEGQNKNSLLPKVDEAITRGDTTFNMSGGEQLRDYLPIEEVASRLVTLVEHPKAQGIFNICSGEPISVRRLIEEYLKKRGKSITLNFGYYPYPTHEPMAFWGACNKINSIIKK